MDRHDHHGSDSTILRTFPSSLRHAGAMLELRIFLGLSSFLRVPAWSFTLTRARIDKWLGVKDCLAVKEKKATGTYNEKRTPKNACACATAFDERSAVIACGRRAAYSRHPAAAHGTEWRLQHLQERRDAEVHGRSNLAAAPSSFLVAGTGRRTLCGQTRSHLGL